MSTSSHLDERSFEQLLAAAYALQQQQRGPVLVPSNTKIGSMSTASQRKVVPVPVAKAPAGKATIATAGAGALPRKNASTEVEEPARLAAIAETQTAVHKNHLTLSQALQLIATSAMNITHASGAGIWLVQSGSAVCRAATGTRANEIGQRMEIATGRLAVCLERDEVLRIWNAQTEEVVFENAKSDNLGGSLLAVPIHHEGRVEGALEVALPRSRHFADADLRTCQILSGLVSEAIAQAAGQEWKHVLDSERATLLDALDRIQPHLARLLSEVEGKPEPRPEPRKELRPVAENSSSSGLARSRSMARLGEYLLTQQEHQAGTERFVDEDLEDSGLEWQDQPQGESWRSHRLPPQELPSTSARVTPREVQTALNLSVGPSPAAVQQFDKVSDAALRNAAPDVNLADVDEEVDSVPPAIQYTKLLARTTGSLDHAAIEDSENTFDQDADTDLVVVYQDPIYSSTEDLSRGLTKASALEFLRGRWADVCLAVSAGILAMSLVWAFWPHAESGRHGATGQPALSPFEQLLVAVGLAEVPAPTTVYVGSPNAQVWVDMHTALYYCSGAEEYGKTEKGKFLTQHQAQYEQFQPALDRACD